MSYNSGITPLVRHEKIGHVAIIWLDDERRRNALSTQLVREIISALTESQEEGARAVVLASKQKAFCAGADVRDMLDNCWLDSTVKDHTIITPPDLFEAIERDPRIVFAAVDGPALGGGVELCLVCDLVVAGSAATFMFPEVGLGVLPNTAIARLPQMVGLRAAAELVFTRRRIDANEALRLGLVSTLAGEETAVNRAVTMAEGICASTPPAVLTAAKRNFARGADWTSIRRILADMDPAEWREGTSAFIGKRAADYDQFWNK